MKRRWLGRLVVLGVILGSLGALGWGWLRANPAVAFDLELWLRRPATYDRGTVDPELDSRIKKAQQAAGKAGYRLTVITSYRSWDQQLSMFREGVVKHGSIAEARKVVLPPWESMHVRGLAVDFSERKGAAWLTKTNGAYGLCQRYANEWWHFEMLGDVGQPCPPLEPDASEGNGNP